jgi:hypothetical protein
VTVRRAGADPDSPPALSTRVELSAGSARTVATTGPFAGLDLTVLDDDLSPPPAGTARVRVLAAATVPAVDVAVAGEAVAGGLAPGDAGVPVPVPAGAATLRVTAGGAPTEAPIDLAAGSVVSLLVLDRPGGGLTVRPVLDAAGAAVVPVGGVAAGSGGAAGRPSPGAVVAVGLALTAAVGIVLSGRRRPLPAVRRLLAATAVAGGVAAAWPPSAPEPPAPAAVVPVVVAAGTGSAAAEPVGVRIPAIGVTAPLDRLGLDADGALRPPAGDDRAGWYTGSSAPGDVGPAVLAGHVDSRSGPAVFWRLRDLVPGDEVVVDRADGTAVRFTVTTVEVAPKADFPTAAVYGPTPRAELRLVTCGGAFDRSARSYTDNVVVTALRVAPSRVSP